MYEHDFFSEHKHMLRREKRTKRINKETLAKKQGKRSRTARCAMEPRWTEQPGTYEYTSCAPSGTDIDWYLHWNECGHCSECRGESGGTYRPSEHDELTFELVKTH